MSMYTRYVSMYARSSSMSMYGQNASLYVPRYSPTKYILKHARINNVYRYLRGL